MPEIKIEKEKVIWPWILMVGIIALLIYWFGFKDKDEKVQQNPVNIDLTNIKENNLTVASFVHFMDQDTIKMELDPTFTKEALLKLVDATNAMADEIHYDIRGNMDRVVKFVNRIVAKPIETSQADDFRQACDILTSTVLKNIQQTKYPALNNEIVKIENIVSTIQPDELIMNQKDVVKRYFKSTAELLQKMN